MAFGQVRIQNAVVPFGLKRIAIDRVFFRLRRKVLEVNGLA